MNRSAVKSSGFFVLLYPTHDTNMTTRVDVCYFCENQMYILLWMTRVS